MAEVKETKVAAKEEAKKKEEVKEVKVKKELPQLKNFPNVNLLDAGDSFILNFELPGVVKKDISVGVNINSVTITGKKKASPAEKEKLKMAECDYGVFNRVVPLPQNVNFRKRKRKGKMKDGVFTIVLQKKDYQKFKSVAVH